jgi:hypothetical protein
VSRWIFYFFSHAVLKVEFEPLFCSISFRERRQVSGFLWVGEFTSLNSNVVCEFWPSLQKLQSCQKLFTRNIHLGFA